jgi:UDP-3-O-[3-hydroxymyristoyl] glucosamine N-acyltransferase
MKKFLSLRTWLTPGALALAVFSLQPRPASAQGTAFTYQGRLYDSGSPACGIYDLEFTLCDAVTNGNCIAGPLTNAATSVANGLFTVTLDFGPVFNGSNFWLQIAARTNGADGFTPLNPPQPLAPAPYAIYAANAASAASFNGSVPDGSLSGAYTSALTLSNAANQFGGWFAGNGAGLSNLPAGNLSGTIPSSSLSLDAGDFTTNLLGQIIATNADMSVNLGNLPNLTKALAANVPPRLLWFGDSTGAYILPSFQAWLQNYSANHAVQLAGSFNGGSWGPESPNYQWEVDPAYFWNPGGIRLINPGTNCYCGGPGGDQGCQYAPGNQIQIWLLASATNGVADLSYSPDFVHWTLLGKLNEAALGEEGLLFVTNFAVPLGKYAIQLSGVSGTFRWADDIGVTVTNNTVPIFYDMHAVGRALQSWTNMGTNIGIILSNVNPCVTFYEQTKPITTYNDYTNFAWWMSNYAPNSDVVLISSYQDSTDPPNGPVAGDNLQRDLLVRAVAVSNHWPFVDVWSPLGPWSNIVAEGLNLDTIVHLNSQGQAVLSQIVMQKLNFAGIWQEAGLASMPLDFQGDLTITSTDFPNSGTTFGAVAPYFSVMSFNADNGNWESAGQWSLGSFTGVANPGTFLKGIGGDYFATTSTDPYGKLWEDGGWSFLDMNRDPHGGVDPGGPGVLLVNTLTNYQSMLIGNNLIVGSSATVSNNLTVGASATVGSNLTVGADATVSNNLTVGADAAVSGNLTVDASAAIGSNLIVGANATVSNNLIVGASAAVSDNFTVGATATVSSNFIVGASATVSSNLLVGATAAVSSNLTVGATATVSNNLAVGASATVGAELTVGDSATVSNNLTVGADATVSSNLAVGASATVAAELTVGDSATVSTNLTVGGDAAVSNNLTVGASAIVSNNLIVGTSATVSNNLIVGTSTTVSSNLIVGTSAIVSNNLIVGTSATVSNNLIVGASATVGSNLTVGTSAAVGAELTVGDSATVSTNLTVGADATVSSNLIVGASATISNNLIVGTSATVSNNLIVGTSTTVSSNLIVGTSATVSNNLIVGTSAAVSSNLTVGTSAAVGSNLTVGTSATVGSNLTVGTSAAVGTELAVGDSATVSTNLTVGVNATVSNDLAVGASAMVGSNLTVGTSAAVGAELAVGDSATVSTNLTVGASATVSNNLTVGTSAAVGAELAVGDSATVGTNLTVGGAIRGNLSFAGTGFASGATSITTSITAATWVNTNTVNGSIWVSTATDLTFFNSAGILVFGPVSVTNAAFPVGPGWTVTNTAAIFNFAAF